MLFFRCFSRADLLRRAWFCHRHAMELRRRGRAYAAAHRQSHRYDDATRAIRMHHGARTMTRQRDELLAQLRAITPKGKTSSRKI